MARIAHFVVPGLPHHVTQRGYRQERDWSLSGNNIPVFFIQGAIKFSDLKLCAMRWKMRAPSLRSLRRKLAAFALNPGSSWPQTWRCRGAFGFLRCGGDR